ncbi:MAG: hypothetical protein V4581_01735 [Bacteroidota bacterium]
MANLRRFLTQFAIAVGAGQLLLIVFTYVKYDRQLPITPLYEYIAPQIFVLITCLVVIVGINLVMLRLKNFSSYIVGFSFIALAIFEWQRQLMNVTLGFLD